MVCGAVYRAPSSVLMAELRPRSLSADALPRFHTPLESPPESPLRDALRIFHTPIDTEESGSDAGSAGLLLPPPPPSRGSSGSSPLLLLSDSPSSVFSDCEDVPPSRPRLPDEFLGASETRKQPPVPPRKLVSITLPDSHRYLSQYAPSAVSPRPLNPVAFQVDDEEAEMDKEPSHALKKFTLSAEFQQLKDSVSEDEELEKLTSGRDEPKSVLKTFTLTPEFQQLKDSLSEDEELDKLASNRVVLEYDVKKQLTLSPDVQHVTEAVCELQINSPLFQPLEESVCEIEVKSNPFHPMEGNARVIADDEMGNKAEGVSLWQVSDAGHCQVETPLLRKLSLKVPPKISPEFYERVSVRRGRKSEKSNGNEEDLAVEDDVKFKNTSDVEVEEPWGWQKTNIVGPQPKAQLDVIKTKKPSLQLGQLLELYRKSRGSNVEPVKLIETDSEPRRANREGETSTEPSTPRSKRRNFCCIQPSVDSELQLLTQEEENDYKKERKLQSKEGSRTKKSASSEKNKDRPRQQRADMPYCRVLKLTASEMRKNRRKHREAHGVDAARECRSDSPDRAGSSRGGAASPRNLNNPLTGPSPEHRLPAAQSLLDFNVDTLQPSADFGLYDFENEPYAKKPIERVESLYENRQPLKTMNSFYDNWKEKSQGDEMVATEPEIPELPQPPPTDLFDMPAFEPPPEPPAAPLMTVVPYSWWPVVDAPAAPWPPMPPLPLEVGAHPLRYFPLTSN